MLTHPTLDHLKALRLDGMAEAFCELQSQDGAAELSHAEWLGLLVDREVASRETKRFEGFCRKKSIDPRTGDCWTQLCCKRRKLLKAGGPVRGDLPFADHVGSLDP